MSQALQPFKFEPQHQPGAGGISFDLKPLDQRAAYIVQASLADGSMPSWEAVEHIFSRFVVGWSGIDPAYSPLAKREVLAGVGSGDWVVWLGEIAGVLYRRMLLGEDAIKN